MKTKRLFFIASLVTGILALLIMVTFTVLLIAKKLDGHNLGALALVLSSGLLTLLFSFFLLKFLERKTLLRSLRMENAYNLGTDSSFYNLYAFNNRIKFLHRLRRKKKNRADYIIAFTAANQATMQNSRRNEEISSLNAKISEALSQIFMDNKGDFSRRDFVFCYNHGAFLIYCINKTEDDIQKVMDRVQDAIYQIVESNAMHVWVSPLFGVAYVKPGEAIFVATENALVARDISEQNFESVTFYDDSLRRSVTFDERKDLLEGIEKKEFVVYYQPKYSLTKKQFVSAEALVRWNSSKFGLLSPSKFVDKAQAIGLIHEINKFVFHKVCEDLNEARRKGRRLLPVSVNFSLYEFYASGMMEDIISVMDEFQIDPHLIEIEITESVSQANQFLSLSIIKKLQEYGIRILMDDFGVGFSNIGNLRKIPFDAVKIDKSMIDRIGDDEKSRDIVKLLINLCKLNDMEVIAEGVDHKDQVDILRRAKCDTIQGFYFSEPLPKKDYEQFLRSNPFEKMEDLS